jgi:hypothetical protein
MDEIFRGRVFNVACILPANDEDVLKVGDGDDLNDEGDNELASWDSVACCLFEVESKVGFRLTKGRLKEEALYIILLIQYDKFEREFKKFVGGASSWCHFYTTWLTLRKKYERKLQVFTNSRIIYYLDISDIEMKTNHNGLTRKLSSTALWFENALFLLLYFLFDILIDAELIYSLNFLNTEQRRYHNHFFFL